MPPSRPMQTGEMKRATLMLSLLLALSGAVAGTTHAADATPATTERLQALDGQILMRLNATRASHGLRPLVVSSALEDAAVAHSRALIQAGVFQHDSPDGTSFVERLKHFYSPSGYATWTAGENLLYNTASIDADTAIQAWLDSPPHRDNMLDPEWREVGIGSVHASTAGGTFGGDPTWVITMDFGARTGGPKAAAKAPANPKAGKAHKKAEAKKAAKKKHKKAKKHAAAVDTKKPAAQPTPASKPKAKPKSKNGQTDRDPPVPSDDAPFTPPTGNAPDMAGDPLDPAAYGHRADEDEVVAPGGEELAPLPPDPLPPPPSES